MLMFCLNHPRENRENKNNLINLHVTSLLLLRNVVMKVLALLTKISFTPNLIHTTMTQFENIHHLNSPMQSQVFVFTNQNFK